MSEPRQPIISFADFKALPLTYKMGMSGEKQAHRMYRNDQHGLQVEIVTARKANGDWHKQQTYYFLDGDDREFETIEACYNAYRWKRGGEAVDV